ncbi:amino acid ABC transporter ATP-binding protein [Nocardia sp. CDC186]|uniref:Amino acid ABC transporter ATP-binding protein n=1 Tax=Nocardia implantans TaxID=3108168 RepID=A0ABU6ARA3_9NOCA|nr:MULTISPECIES: amino acid ABC transporter ATP-binding protein [unclassified Nocardia]MBF6190219.1 amino acid ABC transporter ATP-binding protein [Nocardia beijingensis]MEA3532745.1 amino acid ABC transporter ATP-binding protein [Nocardia sp. CDC192]MEB3509876.1 amino acid ABC transporter ATP-binding protein [Nocardia sp. CDC186]
MSAAPAVRVRGLRKSFGSHEVLRGIDLTVRSGEVVAVIGPSGSGKSTLLRVVNHLETLDAGTVHIDGELIGYRLRRDRLHALPDHAVRKQRSRIGFVFQQFNLFPHLTVLDNVTLAPLSAQRRDRTEVEREARLLLDRVGIGHLADAYPRRLSGGQQQRVAIARALALRPRVILFDEPTSALDPELVGEVLDVIRDLAHGGTALVIVTHEIGFAREVADTVVFLDEGVIVEQGPPSAVLDHPEHPRTRAFLSRVR